MNKYIIILTAILLGTIGAVPANAQPWSLEQCISYAWDHNINLQQQGLTAEQYENSLLQSKIALAPSINARAAYNLSWGYSTVKREITMSDGTKQTIDVQESIFTKNFSPSIYASLDIFQGLRKLNSIHRSQNEQKAAEQDVELMRNNISVNVAQAYLQVLLSTEILTVAENSCKNIAGQLNRIKELVKAGSRPMSEQLDMEAQLAAEEMQRVSAQNQLTSNYLVLRQLLNLSSEAAFEISKPDINIEAQGLHRDDVNSVYATAQALPQIKGAEFRMQSAKYNWNIARGYFWPTLSVSASFGSYFSDSQPSTFWDQLRDHRNPTLGFTLSIPIFNNWSYITNAKNARLNYRIAELEVENKKQTLYKEVQTATNDAIAAYNKYMAAYRNVTASQESFRYVEQKFETGLLNVTDYNVAKTNLLKAQSEEAQSKYQYIFQLKILDLYKGLPIKL